MSDPNSPPPVPQPRKRRGCMFYGCMTLLVLLVLACVLTGLAVWQIRKTVTDYTETQAMALPKVDMSDEEFQKLQARVNEFDDAADHGKETAPLVLSEREVNALIEKSSKTGEVAGHVYVTLKGDAINGKISVPLTMINWLVSGRYLNGEATFKVTMENSVLNVKAQDIKVKGTSLPESVMSTLRSKNIAEDVGKNPDNAASLSHVESIEVKDGTVIVTAKAVK